MKKRWSNRQFALYIAATLVIAVGAWMILLVAFLRAARALE
jgi:hypothetical protein